MAKRTDNQKIKYVDNFLKGIVEICQKISQSAGAALHFTADLNNCTIRMNNVHPVHALSLVDNMVRYSALVNDWGWENVYVEQLKNYFKPGDIVFAFSVHGGTGKDMAETWSQNLVKALKYAQDNGGKAVAITGFDGGL